MIDVSIRIHCSKKAGTLSRIIREIKLFGLDYQNHKISYTDNSSTIVINASGELNCSRDQLVEMFEKFPEILAVEEVKISRDGAEVSDFRTTVSNTTVDARDKLTPAIVLAAEKRMSEILGPVSSFLVEKSLPGCRNVGELYVRLSAELDDNDERRQFLSVIKNIKSSE